MSIRRRVDDAMRLYKLRRFDGALLCALIAAAATARKERPDRKICDRECFEAFLAKGGALRIVRVEFRGELHPVPHIFYKWLRCELVHEGSIPMDIEFVGHPEDPKTSVRAGGAPHFVLQLGHGWMFEILHLVRNSPSNKGEFK